MKHGFLLFLVLFTSSAYADTWQELAPGINYKDVGANILSPWSHIHVFRIDLKKNILDSVPAKSFGQQHAAAAEFVQQSDALLAINGGFFDRTYQPLGLRVGQQKQYNPLKGISWWGVFYIKNQKPYLSSARQYKSNQRIHFAVQSGPRLIVNGKVTRSLKDGLAERSALCVTKSGQVIILVTHSSPMTTTALAELMQAPPLSCQQALNLDGGGSSQVFANIGDFKLDEPGFSNVSDAIVVKERKQ